MANFLLLVLIYTPLTGIRVPTSLYLINIECYTFFKNLCHLLFKKKNMKAYCFKYTFLELSWLSILICFGPILFFLCKLHILFAHFLYFYNHLFTCCFIRNLHIDLDILPKNDLNSLKISRSWRDQLSQFSY